MLHPARRLGFLLSLVLTIPTRAADWPEYRGPGAQGHYVGKPPPVAWSTTKNVAWKQPIPGKGWSSPILWNGHVYLTTAVPVPDSKDWTLEALCMDTADGKLLWRTEVFRENGLEAPKIHSKNSHASPSPVTDGRRLYVHFGHQGTAALDLGGKVLWRNTEHGYEPVHGNGGSPILALNHLVLAGDGADKQFVVALDTNSGKTVWKTDRHSTAPKKFSFGTPLLIEVDGKHEIISPASDLVMALNPADGKEIWRAQYDGYSVIPRPVYGHGMVYFSTSFDRPKLLAYRADGTGDVTKSHLAWSSAKGAPHTPSLLLVGDEVYAVSDSGLASCFDARTGKVHWQERIGGNFSASPLYANGKIYVQSEDGVTTVLKAGTSFESLAHNKLGERTFASFAAADGALYIRTESQLYRIQEK
jgi:outer membrane protein assembly factor BamB